MVGKDIYTNCGTVGQTEWPDREARRRSPTERQGWPAIPNGRAGQTDTRTGAQRRVDGCPTEGDRCSTEGAWVPDGDREWPDGGLDVCPMEGEVSGGGPTAGLGGDPTGDYIRTAGPPFWALFSCAQSHLQEMRERKVLMSESGPLRGEFRKECSPLHCFYN
jgi:hypothetical protein